MTEATLSPRYLARIGDPQTSHHAAATVKDFAPQHHRQILQVLTLHPGGLTVYEIASLCNLDAHAVGKRMKELQATGEVEVVTDLTGEVTRMTPSKRQARVWRRLVHQVAAVDSPRFYVHHNGGAAFVKEAGFFETQRAESIRARESNPWWLGWHGPIEARSIDHARSICAQLYASGELARIIERQKAGAA